MFGKPQRECSDNVALTIFAIIFRSAEIAHFTLLTFSHLTGHLVNFLISISETSHLVALLTMNSFS